MNSAIKTDPIIAGSLRVSHWKAFKATLLVGGNPAKWEEAFRLYFLQRLELRYLHPIKILQENGMYQGEGFSIAAIQCSLLEFLAATVAGKSYVYGRAPDPMKEYTKSGELLQEFLVSAEPFRNHFNANSAKEFYTNIRCGVLHEAATKNGWTIFAKSPKGRTPIDAFAKIVYRDDFQEALLAFVDSYGKRLKAEQPLQEAFIRKFDSLSQ